MNLQKKLSYLSILLNNLEELKNSGSIDWTTKIFGNVIRFAHSSDLREILSSYFLPDTTTVSELIAILKIDVKEKEKMLEEENSKKNYLI